MKEKKELKDFEIYEKISEKYCSIELFKKFFEKMGYLTDEYETFNFKKETFYTKDLKRYLSDPFLAQEIEEVILNCPIEKITGCNLLNYLFNHQINKKLGILQSSKKPLFLIDQIDIAKNKFRVVVLVNDEKAGFILLILVNGFPLVAIVVPNQTRNLHGKENALWEKFVDIVFKKYSRYVRLAMFYQFPKVILIPVSAGFFPRINEDILNWKATNLTIMDKIFWSSRREDIVNNSLADGKDNDIWAVSCRYLKKWKLLSLLQNSLYFSDSYSEIKEKWCKVIWQKEVYDSIDSSIDSLKIHNYTPLELKVSEHPSLPAIVIKKILNDNELGSLTIINYIDENNSINQMRSLISTSHHFFNFRYRGEIDFSLENLKILRNNSIYLASFQKFLENMNLLDKVSKPTLHVIEFKDLLSVSQDKTIQENLKKSFKDKNYKSLKLSMTEILNIPKAISEENNRFLVLDFV